MESAKGFLKMGVLASKHSWANHFIAVGNGVVTDFSVLRPRYFLHLRGECT